MDWFLAGRLRIGGHRGARGMAPENTLAGIAAAHVLGVDYVEMDVRRSADGVLVLMHDATVDRTTDGRGGVSELTLEQLRGLDTGAGERVPTLAEALTLVESLVVTSPAGFGAALEVKAPGTGGELARIVRRSPARDHLAITSFNANEIVAAKAAWRDVPCLLLLPAASIPADPLAAARACGADGLDFPPSMLDRRLVADLHAIGLMISGALGNDRPTIARLLQLGVDLVDSDAPALAIAARDELVAA